MNLKIKQSIEKIPGGMMVVPLVLGALTNTFFPELLEIGGFTTALFKNGAATLIAAFLLCMGAGIELKAAPRAIKKGAVVTITKFIVAVGIGLFVSKFLNDSFLGLSSLAIIAAIISSKSY